MYLSPALSSGQVAEMQQATLVEGSRQTDESQRRGTPEAAAPQPAETPPSAPVPDTKHVSEPSHLGRWLNAKA